ncbi:phosphatases II [Cucurbitaria berberidis CBS 394.84]|uniref:Phosphatases II n=1 Tax=Cucurbitaria berberidis CBS 394.84 TaxID=1168544 RepID=A0A9P4GRT9_9PLEO|nr:phosphatases II [Cucurbitaria berberidis CBS 394.84]KAF1850652.1 phosphatases II [Cucurbitaria berberidis CBS 394.84]
MTPLREASAMSDLSHAYKRNLHEYSYRLPTPPRIVVPPPTLTIDMPDLTVRSGVGTEGVDMSFLEELDLENIVQTNTLVEWAYERRRQAQLILPWLYLGPMMAARDKAFLEREGITMVLAIRSQTNSMMGAVQAATEVCWEVATVEAASIHELIGRFTETTRLINTHVARVRQHTLEKNGHPTLGKVLVFCESGNEKSAAVVAAYLMQTLGNFDHVKAMQVCQAQRFCVNFDDTIKNILHSHWDIIHARRLVASCDTQSPQQTGAMGANGQNGTHLQPVHAPKQKRSIAQTRDDEDMEMDDGMDESDALRFTGRDVTPFHDS